MPEFRKLRSGGYRCQLLPDRLKVSNKGTIRAVERIAKTILTEDCTCLYVRFWCRQRRGLAIMGYGASQN